MRVCIHRGSKEIGGSCLEVESGGKRLLLDFGLPLEAQKEAAPQLALIPGLDGSDASLLGLWQKKADDWRKMLPVMCSEEEKSDSSYLGPKIHIRPIVFRGTYDDFQHKVTDARRKNLKAHLFGELLGEETLKTILPETRSRLERSLREAAPDFSPSEK